MEKYKFIFLILFSNVHWLTTHLMMFHGIILNTLCNHNDWCFRYFKIFLSFRLIGVIEIKLLKSVHAVQFLLRSNGKVQQHDVKTWYYLTSSAFCLSFWITVDFAKMMSWLSNYILFDIYIYIYNSLYSLILNVGFKVNWFQ